MKQSGSVPSSENLPIYYDLYLPDMVESSSSLPLILFLHGFKGFKDWGAFPDACEALSSAGFAVLAINFSLNGVGQSMTNFDELDLFARETLSQDLDDVGAVIEALGKNDIEPPEPFSLRTDAMGIIGHSRGGHTAVAAAAEYPEIQCLVTWSAVADYNARWSNQMIEDWEKEGVTEIVNGRTGQIMPVKKVVYEDALDHADRLIAVKRVQELQIPALFIHSKDDEAVPAEEARKLFNHCPSDQKELQLMPDSGHTFDTSHPFEEKDFPPVFRQVLTYTRKWFQRFLQ
ncbi:alpha/beta hydrolase family protein [Fodinibius sediminis]|uniref:Prolyl oligopeptidase family protein n=1 Tax=Fodinibius sediminis TaxID=1214077 RepID=A0A521AMS2_9BACT|nr:alpha/beta fold hydrolase [Fodinibius sediminis]SMO36092.1 Prolyl oligopeptidase family protein [Fodinibius sediminis]